MRTIARPYWKWIATGFGVLVLAVVLGVVFFEWHWLRGPLEARLSAATGKTVQILGPITGGKSWTPTIVLEDIKIEEPDWKPDPQVAKIDRIEATVEVKKLLRGRLSLPTLIIIGPDAKLERRGDTANWDIAREADGPDNRHDMPIIGDLTVRDGKISYRDPAKQLRIDGTLAILKGDGGMAGGPFTLEGKGTYQRAPFTLKLTGDSLVHMRDRSEPYKVDVRADLGRTRIIAGGTIADPIKMRGLALGLQIRGDNAADLYNYLGIPAPITPPYQLGGTLDRYEQDVWVFRDFGGRVGASDVYGSLSFDLGKPRLVMKGDLVSTNLNLADFGVAFGVPTKPDANQPVNEHQKRTAEAFAQSDRLLPRVPLQVNAIRNVDIDVNFNGEKVVARDLPLEQIDMHITTKDGGILSLDPVQVTIAGGKLRGTAVIDARGDIVQSDADIRITDFKLEQFFKPHGEGEAAATGVIDGRVRFKGQGDTLAAALASADGTAGAIITDGTISKMTSSLLGLDVARALGVLISGDKKIALRCVVTDFEVKAGAMAPRVFVIDTADVTIKGGGTIDLAEERMDLTLKGEPKGGTLSLRGPILLKGTFRDPSLGLGAEAIARGAGSVILGTLLSPIAAIVAFIDSGKDKHADCEGLEAIAQQNAAGAPPVDKTPPPPKRAKGTGQSRNTQSGGR